MSGGLSRRGGRKFLGEVRCETEVLLVNDGRSDQTLPKIAAWAAADKRVKIVHLSRNFGHQIAATAGLDYAGGDAVALVDADLQYPLSVIHRMIDRYCEGYEVVYGQRQERRGESALKRFTALAFYRLMRTMFKSLWRPAFRPRACRPRGPSRRGEPQAERVLQELAPQNWSNSAFDFVSR